MTNNCKARQLVRIKISKKMRNSIFFALIILGTYQLVNAQALRKEDCKCRIPIASRIGEFSLCLN